jgi:hypothetical protein
MILEMSDSGTEASECTSCVACARNLELESDGVYVYEVKPSDEVLRRREMLVENNVDMLVWCGMDAAEAREKSERVFRVPESEWVEADQCNVCDSLLCGADGGRCALAECAACHDACCRECLDGARGHRTCASCSQLYCQGCYDNVDADGSVCGECMRCVRYAKRQRTGRHVRFADEHASVCASTSACESKGNVVESVH